MEGVGLDSKEGLVGHLEVEKAPMGHSGNVECAVGGDRDGRGAMSGQENQDKVSTTVFGAGKGTPTLNKNISLPSGKRLSVTRSLNNGKEVQGETRKRGLEVVTLLWLKACCRIGCWLPPEDCEQVFRPQSWAIVKPPPKPLSMLLEKDVAASAELGSQSGTNADTRVKAHRGGRGGIVVSLTGFQKSQRVGVELLLEAVGMELCKNLSKRSTTHLVCKEVSYVS
ncbi:unnamed protein product [Choristocarpus tenellus]